MLAPLGAAAILALSSCGPEDRPFLTEVFYDAVGDDSALEFAEYYCGEPAPDVPAGQSLARIPDGAHQGGNASDFRAAPPTPGRANQPALDAAWVPGSLTLDPEQPGPLETARLSGTIEN